MAVSGWYGRNLCSPKHVVKSQLQITKVLVLTMQEDTISLLRLLFEESMPELGPLNPRHRKKQKEDPGLALRDFI